MREIKTSSRHHKKNAKLIETLLAGGQWAADLLGEKPSAKLVAEVHKQLIDNRKFFVRIDSGPLNYI